MGFLSRSRVHFAWIALLAAVAASRFSLPASGQASQPAGATTRVPVLVELFTSEGCSDCPPADRLLAQLDTTQFVPGANAVVLSEHVTYWNHQGWSDPFSLDEMTARQQQYVNRFGLQDSYTPQMVVDGATQFVGNDPRALNRAVAEAASVPKQTLSIEDAHWENSAAQFSVRGAADPGTRLIAVLAADATQSEVSRGENAGRKLHHVAVVRVMKDLGSNAADGRPLRLAGGSLFHTGEATGPVRLVVFLVDHKTGHVRAVAEQTLGR
jgi:hypothetical protein